LSDIQKVVAKMTLACVEARLDSDGNGAHHSQLQAGCTLHRHASSSLRFSFSRPQTVEPSTLVGMEVRTEMATKKKAAKKKAAKKKK